MSLSKLRKFFRKPSVRFGLLLAVFVSSIATAGYFLVPISAAQFSASVDTRTLKFKLGKWTDSAGIFNSDFRRVNLVLGHVDLQEPGGAAVHCEPGSRLGNVRIPYQTTFPNEEITLTAEQNGTVHYRLTPPPDSGNPYLIIQFDRKSDLRQFQCLKRKDADEAELHISASMPDLQAPAQTSTRQPLEFWVDFTLTPTAPPTSQSPASAGPEDETAMPLAGESTMYFQGREGLVGTKNTLIMHPSDREVELQQGLTLEGLQNATLTRLHYELKENYFHVETEGTAKTIKVKFGDTNQVQKAPRFPIAKLAAGSLGDVTAALATTFGSLLSLYGMILQIQAGKRQHLQQIREGRKQHKERMAFDALKDPQTPRAGSSPDEPREKTPNG
jgi:hypothetical protein